MVSHIRIPISPRRLRWLRIIFVLAACFVCGCNPPPRPPMAAPSEKTRETPDISSQVSEPDPASITIDETAANAPSGDAMEPLASPVENIPDPSPVADLRATPPESWETWDAYYIRGEPIGYAHVQRTPQDDGTVRYFLEDQMTLRRGSSLLTNRVTQSSIETEDGQLVSFEATLLVGPSRTQFIGKRQADQLQIDVVRGGDRSERSLDWRSEYSGLLGVQQSLRDQPMRPGEQRTLQTLMPVYYELGEIELQATVKRPVPVLDGQLQTLTEVLSRLTLGSGAVVESYLWIDDEGNTLKSYTPAMNLTAFRTDQATAMAEVQPRQDLLTAASLQLSQPISNASSCTTATFRLRPTKAFVNQPLPEIAAAAGQQASPPANTAGESDSEIEITVNAGLDRTNRLAPPGPADLAANPLIDSDDARIQAIARAAVVGAEPSPRETAVQLTGFVRQFMKHKDFSRGFSNASQVARDATGDCTEHAVLLAALLRCRKIPCRLVAGLTYVETPAGPAMLYHMWNVAYVDDGWLPLDATLGNVPPASRIALVTTNLAGGNEFECLSPILSIMGRIEIETTEGP